jgi:hypothetical protein
MRRAASLIILLAGLGALASDVRAEWLVPGSDGLEQLSASCALSASSGDFDAAPSLIVAPNLIFAPDLPFDAEHGLCSIPPSDAEHGTQSSSSQHPPVPQAAIEPQSTNPVSDWCVRLLCSTRSLIPDPHLSEVFHPPKPAA